MSKKPPLSSSSKGVIVVICVVGGIALAVIVAAIIIMFFTVGRLLSSDGGSSDTNSIDQNNAIQAEAIEQKDSSLCDNISGETSASIPLPSGNKLQTFDEAESKQRCKTQATAGQPYVY